VPHIFQVSKSVNLFEEGGGFKNRTLRNQTPAN